MKIIDSKTIRSLGITPSQCVEWVRESFSMKYEASLPPKISLHPQNDDFINTMPCLLPEAYHRYGVKVVTRIEGAIPALSSTELLFNSATGELLAMLDADWITAMRTGAVATLSAQLYRKSNNVVYGIAGLGNTGRATILCLLDSEPNIHHHVYLLRYKNQAELFMERMKDYKNVSFTIVDSPKEIVKNCDVIFSCITSATGLFCEDDSAFRKGCVVIPVHTRGFQNCDLFFDKVFGDDTGHVCGFRYFEKFKKFAELSEVLLGKNPGRESEDERILAYNIGLGLHDVLFANKIYELTQEKSPSIPFEKATDKFWV